jgi:hypothetical protein
MNFNRRYFRYLLRHKYGRIPPPDDAKLGDIAELMKKCGLDLSKIYPKPKPKKEDQ